MSGHTGSQLGDHTRPPLLENMMSDSRADKLAQLLVNYCVAVKPGDKVYISGSVLGLPLVRETYRQVVRAGGHPYVVWMEDEMSEILLKEGSDEQLRYIHEPTRMLGDTYDCRIAIRAAVNTRTLTGVDPARQRIASEASRELMATFMRRSASGELRWVTTIFPTAAHAQDADMSLNEYEDFVYQACQIYQDDPVAEWQKVATRQQRLIDWLSDKKEVRIAGPNIEMTLSIDGRTFISDEGRRNMPGGEIFTGPVEESVNGWVHFTYPAIHGGREVEGIELRFEQGKVVEARARKNEAYLHSVLDTDPGARYLGEFAIGTNHGIDRFTRSILFDEKIGGTLHMAVGAGYPESGSQNKSAVHWDMICDMRDGGKIWVDDELFYDSGRFLLLESNY
jgi:aminopeptidase